MEKFYNFKSLTKEELEVKSVFFANIVWMSRYNGFENNNTTGFSWVRRNKDAGEKYNFRNVEGKYYGYVESRNKKINLKRIAKRYNCDIYKNENNSFIKNALVIFFSTPKNGTAKIIGFYNNATIYENLNFQVDNHGYYFECNVSDAYLIPEENRFFEIPKKINNVTTYGQNPKWYADKDEHKEFVAEVLSYIKNFKEIVTVENEEIEKAIVLSKQIIDNEIKVLFDINEIKGVLPIQEIKSTEKRYRYGGTSAIASTKIYSGRKTEKYFLDFLKQKQFIENKDYIDVANSRKLLFDVSFYDIGLEIKNIKSGGFFLTDNEIHCLQNNQTHLILIDVGNGIWFLKNTSYWLRKVLKNINKIKNYCKTFNNFELNDIRVNLDKSILSDKGLFEISKLSKNQIFELITEKN